MDGDGPSGELGGAFLQHKYIAGPALEGDFAGFFVEADQAEASPF